MIEKKYKKFLLEQAKAGEAGHGRRRLYDHLCGTHGILERWGNSEPVCLAGLFHSIYGTNKYRHKSWPIEDRKTIIDLIGREAEALVYVFCTTSRPGAFFPLSELSAILPELARPLREIEAANLIEQGSYSRFLNKLLDSDISDAAKTDIKWHLAERERHGPSSGHSGERRPAGYLDDGAGGPPGH